MRLKAHGKFLFLNGEKFYFKSVRMTYPQIADARLSCLGVNSVWLTNPDTEQLETLSRLGLMVVAELGFDDRLRAWFAGEKRPFQRWAHATERLIKEIGGYPGLVAYDLGGPVSGAVRRLACSPEPIPD